MKGVFQVEMKKMIPLFMDYCMSRQLRPKTMLSYEQANHSLRCGLRNRRA